jgi:CMP-N-acetylneuraminic acid synthetase
MIAKNCICIIPAKKNSQRLKNKNILNFKNKPIICHTIESAIKSKVFDLIVVSSDSKKILDISSKYKNVYLHKRSKNLSTRTSTVNDVCLNILKIFKKKKINFKFISCLYATSPLRNNKDIINSYKLLKKKKTNFVIAVSKYNYPPHQALKKNNQYLKPFFPNIITKKTNFIQNKIYVDNGSTYFGKTIAFLKNKSFYGKSLRGYYMPFSRSIDIDTKDDFELLKKITFKV